MTDMNLYQAQTFAVRWCDVYRWCGIHLQRGGGGNKMNNRVYEVVSPRPIIDFDYYFEVIKPLMDEEGYNITGEEREEVLSCLHPILDIVGVDNNDIYLYSRHPFNGFNVITRFFQIGAFVICLREPKTEGYDYAFVIRSEFIELNENQRLGSFGLAFDVRKPVKGADFTKALNKLAGDFVERKEGEIK